MKKEQIAILQVQATTQYVVPMAGSGQRTEINGWTMDEVIQDWFRRYDLNQHHASRDARRIGGSTIIQDIRVAGELLVETNEFGQLVIDPIVADLDRLVGEHKAMRERLYKLEELGEDYPGGLLCWAASGNKLYSKPEKK